MFDNPTDNHTDIEVPLYYELRFTKLKKAEVLNLKEQLNNSMVASDFRCRNTHSMDNVSVFAGLNWRFLSEEDGLPLLNEKCQLSFVDTSILECADVISTVHHKIYEHKFLCHCG